MAGNDGRQLGGDAAGFAGDGNLNIGIGRDVDDETAPSARQMVVVLPAERFAQLKAIVVADSSHTLQDADALEYDEVAVQRTLRCRRTVLPEQVGDSHRPTGRGDEVEDRPALLRETLADTGEASLGGGVEIVAIGAAAWCPVGRHAVHRTVGWIGDGPRRGTTEYPGCDLGRTP